MTHTQRPFRFGWQITQADESASAPSGPLDAARRAEACGFDIILSSDHVGAGDSPIPQLAAIAAATSTIRVGTFVLNADMRNPVQLAWEVATVQRMSGGRFELGLGAGHTPHEYAETGIELLAPTIRKQALAERIEILRRLLDGDEVDWAGKHHRLAGASIGTAGPEHVPILVGGNGDALLAHAARHADIIGLQGLGRTLDDGHRHTVKWTTEHLDAQVDHIRRSAGDRFAEIELNALVQVVTITDDPNVAADARAGLLERVDGLSADQIDQLPYVLIGSVEEVVEKLHRCRERWGISYFAVRELEAFTPVIDACR